MRREYPPRLIVERGGSPELFDVNSSRVAHHVLLVEDNEDNRVIYGTMLRAHGFRVHEECGGEAGLLYAQRDQPELVLMDIGLPLMDGVEATRRLKQDPRTASIPVLALTAHGLASERARADAAGFDGYLVKPISSDDLMRAVCEALLRVQRTAVQSSDHPDSPAL